jgi:hypothetical protein
MANTFTLIASSTVGAGGAANITFTSIPSTYTDLVIKYSTRATNNAGVYARTELQFNTDTGNNYTSRLLYGTGGSAGSDVGSSVDSIRFFYTTLDGATASSFSNGEIYIPNAFGSTQKSVSMDSVVETNATSTPIIALTAGLWTGTSAISSIKMYVIGYNFMQYSTAYLYGVSKS